MNTYNEAELSNFKLADITDLYNQLATVTGNKPVKKFRDKATAVKRTLVIQDVATPYTDVEPEAVEPEAVEPEAVEPEAVEPEAVEPEAVEPEAVEPEVTKKPASKGNSKTDMTATVFIAKERNNKEGSIGDCIFKAVVEFNNPTVQELTDHIVGTYRKPRSNVAVTAGFVVSTIRFFVKESTLKLS